MNHLEVTLPLIRFKINNNILELSLQSGEEDLHHKLLNNDSYTIQYLKLLIQNGLFVINNYENESLKEIYRLQEDRETLIYNVNINENRNRQEPYIDKENNSDVGVSSVLVEGSMNNQKFADSWSDSATAFMLDKYAEYLPQVGPLKKLKTKKLMWTQLSNDLQEHLNIFKTPLQIENRYKTVLKRKKKAVENNHKSGSSREEVPFEKELEKIAQSDDSIEPEVLRSARSVKYLKKPPKELESLEIDSNTSDIRENFKDPLQEQPPKKKSKVQSSEEKRIELFKQKEEAKEKRHLEKMQLLRELFSKKQNEND